MFIQIAFRFMHEIKSEILQMCRENIKKVSKKELVYFKVLVCIK